MKLKKVTLNEIKSILVHNETMDSLVHNIYFDNVSSIDKAINNSLIWIKENNKHYNNIIKKTPATVIIVHKSFNIESIENKCIIKSDNPKYTFSKIVNKVILSKNYNSIHESSIISKNAIIGKNVSIGPNTFIGDCQIGDNTIIMGNNYLYDNVKIGDNVTIHAGTTIGSPGFGYSKMNSTEYELFPHIGGVIIEDNVEIGSNTCIDRGSLDDTIIKKGVKIDNLVHIAHNVIIEENSLIIANSMLGGSTLIGKNSWIAPSASIKNQLKIGDNVTVGMGAVVTKNIPNDETWTGVPAKRLDVFVKIQNQLKKLLL